MAKAKKKPNAGPDVSGMGVPDTSVIDINVLDRLAGGDPLVRIDNLHAGYGRMRVLHDVSLRLARGKALCLVGPNGAGKSTVLNAIFGFAKIFSGAIAVSGSDMTKLKPSQMLSEARLAYVLQKELGVSRHDGRGESADGRLSARAAVSREAGGRGGARTLPQAQGACPRTRRAFCRAASGGCSRFRAH